MKSGYRCSGLNIPFYSRHVETLYGLDPSRELWKMARKRADRTPFPIEHIGLSGENIPMQDKTFDTVVITWTLCSITNPVQALVEMRRVLKQEGLLIFVEQGIDDTVAEETVVDALVNAYARE